MNNSSFGVSSVCSHSAPSEPDLYHQAATSTQFPFRNTKQFVPHNDDEEAGMCIQIIHGKDDEKGIKSEENPIEFDTNLNLICSNK